MIKRLSTELTYLSRKDMQWRKFIRWLLEGKMSGDFMC